MSVRSIYKVRVLDFHRYNSTQKKGHQCTLVPNNLGSDARLNATSTNIKWLYINLFLICGDYKNDTIMITERQVNDLLTARLGCENALYELQSLQLVTYEQIEIPFKNRIEKKRKEKKGIEVPMGSDGPPPVPMVLEIQETHSPPKPKPNTDANRKCWDAYRDAYRSRWKVEPTRNQVVNSAISNFVKRVGEEDAPDIIKFFVSHNDGLYLKSMHDVKLAVRDAEALRGQWLKGRAITSKDIRDFEKTNHYAEQLAKVERGEI